MMCGQNPMGQTIGAGSALCFPGKSEKSVRKIVWNRCHYWMCIPLFWEWRGELKRIFQVSKDDRFDDRPSSCRPTVWSLMEQKLFMCLLVPGQKTLKTGFVWKPVLKWVSKAENMHLSFRRSQTSSRKDISLFLSHVSVHGGGGSFCTSNHRSDKYKNRKWNTFYLILLPDIFKYACPFTCTCTWCTRDIILE